MMLIIGGRAQGKLQYVMNVLKVEQNKIAFCDEEPLEKIFDFDVIYNLHKLVLRLINEGTNPLEYILPRLEGRHTIICNEIGCGVVPIDKNNRIYRDMTGRLCCEIAALSAVVERVNCGLAVRIKG